ncbi:MAG: Stp1/IreP family PP2C-type Ser/Thr phosphatase [Lachnospiraceae bacterium]|nr:Stp1/IreP family PP2C-type Ser/Thr phosphatase [Lachnospiraceae bacterium]MBP5565629.1 Stp1/IreP family PP2C-type Ser/Thr phosphatase [Lachnospiraceae bacterium]MBQ4275456.1 Stp1/IreP family PP2C-type Ser/Thr phosphatase [Lachnospiraceae bacterium]MCR4696260.1 Stp1/IreP family PP2C-type Ser/Thr phosphatase [Lachnospiraceae bacterium]
MKSVSKTDIGKLRQLNQDFVFTSELPLGALDNLFLVADGMGGHKAGDYASKCAVETVIQMCSESKGKRMVTAISDAINEANTRIRRKAMEDENMVGMGTTMVLATVSDDTLTVANVGDSRLYIVSDENTITQITRDHSLVEEMVRMGGIDRVSARNHPDKNIITRAIGATGNVNIDFFEVPLKDGDVILMCSDGLSNMIDDKEILKIVSGEEDIEESAAKLIETANSNGGSDNISVVLIKYER